ncbi:hypothetical protein [Ruegeria arenilitoris]|uniref:hypothetical protein n=1 Tax=Ruegeria arenilitoris TaxID=1173585 RepID=UPI00147ED71D|nr:hypothetical protein [Ruegeria arenilitoris]
MPGSNHIGGIATTRSHADHFARLLGAPYLAPGLQVFTDPDLAKQNKMNGAVELKALIDSNLLAAFLPGYDSALEESLLRDAETNARSLGRNSGLDNRYDQGVIYLKTAGEVDRPCPIN